MSYTENNDISGNQGETINIWQDVNGDILWQNGTGTIYKLDFNYNPPTMRFY
jgi:hypothetical protein